MDIYAHGVSVCLSVESSTMEIDCDDDHDTRIFKAYHAFDASAFHYKELKLRKDVVWIIASQKPGKVYSAAAWQQHILNTFWEWHEKGCEGARIRFPEAIRLSGKDNEGYDGEFVLQSDGQIMMHDDEWKKTPKGWKKTGMAVTRQVFSMDPLLADTHPKFEYITYIPEGFSFKSLPLKRLPKHPPSNIHKKNNNNGATHHTHPPTLTITPAPETHPHHQPSTTPQHKHQPTIPEEEEQPHHHDKDHKKNHEKNDDDASQDNTERVDPEEEEEEAKKEKKTSETMAERLKKQHGHPNKPHPKPLPLPKEPSQTPAMEVGQYKYSTPTRVINPNQQQIIEYDKRYRLWKKQKEWARKRHYDPPSPPYPLRLSDPHNRESPEYKERIAVYRKVINDFNAKHALKWPDFMHATHMTEIEKYVIESRIGDINAGKTYSILFKPSPSITEEERKRLNEKREIDIERAVNIIKYTFPAQSLEQWTGIDEYMKREQWAWERIQEEEEGPKHDENGWEVVKKGGGKAHEPFPMNVSIFF